MKSLFKRLKERKGFTLVECIVAIAVFAALCLMVAMIIGGAQRESIKAHDTETELNGLIDNVLDDDLDRRYNSTYSNKKLEMSFSGDATGNFAITYDLIDGHKNHIVCDSCGYFANNAEFSPNGKTEQFLQTAMNYVCPVCKHQPVKVTLKCADCGATGSYSNSAAFLYEKTSGSYMCNTCGSGYVSSTEIDENLMISQSNVSVKGIAANAIRYGTLKKPEKANVITVTDDSGAPSDKASANVKVKYTTTNATNPNVIGEYRIDIGSVIEPDDPDPSDPVKPHTTVQISIPNGYFIEDFKCNNSSTIPDNVTLLQPDYAKDERGSISWTSTDSQKTIYFTFKLRNYKTGFSFDYDYTSVLEKEGSSKYVSGLAQYWFGLASNGGGEKWPIT